MVDDLTRAVAVPGDTAVAEDALPAELLRLGKELQCPICLGILKAPTARLPCCHYFCLDCINESLKHRTACPSCKLFARKRDVTRDFKIDRVATLYSQLEAATGRYVYCSQPSSPAAPPEIAAAAEAFVVPSPPQEEYETAREEFGMELSEGAAVAAPAKAAPVLQLWAASQDFMQQSLTQHSGGWPSMTPPTQFAAEQQERPPTGCGVSALQSVELQESMVEETQGFGSGQQVQGRVGAAPGSKATATGKAMERSDDTCQKSGHGASERDEFLMGGEDALLLGAVKPVPAAGRRGRRRKNETATKAGKTTLSANRNPLHDVSNKSLRGGRRLAASKAPVGSSGAVSEGVPTTPAADSGQKLTLPPPPSSLRRVPARLQVWTCRMCTLENAGTAKKCAVCDTPRTSSGALAAATTAADPVTVEEVATRHRHGNSTISDFQEPDCPPLELARWFNIGDGQGEQSGVFPAAEMTTMPSRKKNISSKKPADEGPKESGSRKKARKGGAVAQSSGATAKATKLSAAGGSNGVVIALAPNATPSGDDISAPNKSKAKGTGRQHQRVANEMGAESASAAAGEAPQGEGLEAELPKSDQRAKKRKAGCVRVRANKASASRQRTEKSAKVSSGVPIPAAVPPPPLVTPPTRAVEPLAASDSVKVADHAKSPTVAAGAVVTTAAHDLKWARSMRSSWTFLGSGLADEMDKENLYALATASGARVVDSYDSRVTHVVCGVDTEGRAKRTAKYMHGILEGAWVVSAQWMTACILAGSPVDEKDFEVVGDSGGGTGGPAAGRARREEGRPKLLAGKEVVLHGSFTSKEAVKAIVTAAGGRLLPRLAPSAAAKDSLVVVIEGKSAGQGGGGRSARQTDGPATALSLAVSLNWLMDSVGAHALQAPEAYRL